MNEIIQEVEEIRWCIEPAKQEGEYTFSLSNEKGSRYVLSKYSPKRNIKIDINVNEYNKETIWIMFGFGFGYMLEKLFQNYGEDIQVIVIEPNLKLLKEQLELIDTKALEDKKGLTFFTGTNIKDFKQLIANRVYIGNVYNIEILEHPEYVQFYLKYFQKTVQVISEIRAQRIVNDNTIRQINSMHVKNILKNSIYINESFDIEQHKNRYKGIPAVIVSAGPSLNQNIEYLKEFKGLVFAVGRTLPAIKRQGVKADFTALLDWSEMIKDTFGGEEKAGIPIIALTVANNSVITDATGPIYFIDENAMAEKMLGIHLESLDIAGSVATLCLSAAYYMGCDPIIFIGQDLAYTGMKGYANSCNVYEIDVEESFKKDKGRYREIEGYNGEKVISDYALISFLRWIENFISNNNDRTYINATEGGAKIEGTIQECFSNVVEKYKNIIKPEIGHIKSKAKYIEIKDSFIKCEHKLDNSLELIKRAINLCNALKDEYDIYLGMRKNEITRIVQELDTIDNKLLKIENNTLFDYIFQAKYNEIMSDKKYQEPINETEVEKGRRITLKSYHLYKSLYEAVDNVRILIKNHIQEVEQ